MLVVSSSRNSKYFTRMLVESRDTTCLLLAELLEELHSIDGVGICNKSICPRTAGVRPRPASSWCSWTARARPRPASSCCSWPFQLVRAAAASLRCCNFLSLLLSATILLRPISKLSSTSVLRFLIFDHGGVGDLLRKSRVGPPKISRTENATGT